MLLFYFYFENYVMHLDYSALVTNHHYIRENKNLPKLQINPRNKFLC